LDRGEKFNLLIPEKNLWTKTTTKKITKNIIYFQRYSQDVVFNQEFCAQDGIENILQFLELEDQRSITAILSTVLMCLDDQFFDYKELIQKRPDFTDLLLNRILNDSSDHVSSFYKVQNVELMNCFILYSG
jgi:hypothetical protein